MILYLINYHRHNLNILYGTDKNKDMTFLRLKSISSSRLSFDRDRSSQNISDKHKMQTNIFLSKIKETQINL